MKEQAIPWKCIVRHNITFAALIHVSKCVDEDTGQIKECYLRYISMGDQRCIRHVQYEP